MKTYDEVKSILSVIEPTDFTYEGITAEDIPVLQQLLTEKEPWLAARVVFAMSKIQTKEANEILIRLAQDPRTEIRVALAASVKFLRSDDAEKILQTLVMDQEAGVRKFAFLSVSPNPSPIFREQLKEILERETIPQLSSILQMKVGR